MMKEEQAASAAVPEASPDLNEKKQHDDEVAKPSSSTTSTTSRKRLYLFSGVAFLIIAVLCIVLPLTLIDDDDDDDSSDNAMLGTAAYVSMERTLPLFNSDITDGYGTKAELENALTLALQAQAKQIIDTNVRNYQQYQQYNYGTEEDGMEPPMAGRPMDDTDMAMTMADGAESAAMNSGGAASEEGVTDFGTNVQEENVDEADIIKADANYIYAAYGDYILVWDTNGEIVAQVAMPPIELPENWGEQQTGVSSTKKSMIAPDYWQKPKPHIDSMMLTDNHLIAIVSGYNNDYRYYYGYEPLMMEGQALDEPPHIIREHKATQIRLYEKHSSGNLHFKGKTDVNGYFVDARSIGDVVHLATASSVDTWTYLQQPLDWWQISNGTEISVDDYVVEASKKVNEAIPLMTDQLLQDLQMDGDELPTMLQINQWFTHLNETEDGEDAGFVLPHYQTYDVVSNIAQVTSFNVNSALTEAGEVSTTSSAYMSPNSFSTLYGTEDHLVLATSGWDWNPFIREGEQTTYLVALEIKGDTTEFLSVGTIKGYLLNQYALDIVDGELRAATTVERMSWWWWGPMPMGGGMVDDVAVEDVAVARPSGGGRRKLQGDPKGLCPTKEEDACVNDDNYQECLAFVEEGCTAITIMESCPLQFGCSSYVDLEKMDPDGLCPTKEEDACVNDDNYRECVDLVIDGCIEIAIMESCPLQFDCQVYVEEVVDPPMPPPPEPEESRTENYMVVLKLVGEDVPAGQMSEKGRVQIGEKNERITSVRFFDNVAYAVTFERTDPFYVLDMSVPKVLGELKLPGFSSYLHSMNADNTLLLAVGQNATDDGRTTGLMVTVFDATDPAQPKALVSHTFESSEEAYSGSSVEWDYKAFRYVDGKLVVPLEIWYNQVWDSDTQQLLPLPEGAENFQGFAVLDVSTTAIKETYRVSHMKEEGACHYCQGGYLPQRSFVYSGNLMTVRDNIVVSTGLHDGVEKWRFTLKISGEAADCCW